MGWGPAWRMSWSDLGFSHSQVDRGVGWEGELNNKLKMFITRYGGV